MLLGLLVQSINLTSFSTDNKYGFGNQLVAKTLLSTLQNGRRYGGHTPSTASQPATIDGAQLHGSEEICVRKVSYAAGAAVIEQDDVFGRSPKESSTSTSPS